MKKKLLKATLILLLFCQQAKAQYSEFLNDADTTEHPINMGNGSSSIKFAGRLSMYYENRLLKTGQTNLKHNNFSFKDIDLDLQGKIKSHFSYEIHVSVLDIVTAASIGNSPNLTNQSNSNISPNPYNSGLKAIYFNYDGKGLPFEIKLGYDKLPFSQGSLDDSYNTPYWSHPNLVGGDLFSRRDLGVTLHRSLWRKRINLYAGAYSGLGENIFEYSGDGSGHLEYIGRAEFSYPVPVKYNAIDQVMSPIPVFRIGLNARYTNKTQPTGRSLLADVPDALGPYNTRIVNGKKNIYGGDFIFKYHGLSVLCEVDFINMKPTIASDALFEATPVSFNKGKVLAGGYSAGINYNSEKIHSVFSTLFEEINGNDLIAGKQQWWYFGYAYKFNGFHSVLKFEYYKPVLEDATMNPLKYTDQFRIGYQIIF